MRIVVLDIDGVLNSRAWFAGKPVTDTALSHLDPIACLRVQRLCDEAKADIVISSTWRLLHKRLMLKRMLGSRGITARIIGVTPAIPMNKGRGEEIQRWLDVAGSQYVIDGMVILDDDQDMLHLDSWLVRTSFETGITDAHVEEALRVIARPMPAVMPKEWSGT